MHTNDLKRFFVLVVGCTLLLGGRPAAAEEKTCAALLPDVVGIGDRVHTVKNALTDTIRAVKELETMIEEMIEADKAVAGATETADAVITYAAEVAPIAEPVPSVHTAVQRIKAVLVDIKRYLLSPIKKVLDSAVVAPRLKENLPRIKKLRQDLEDTEKPVALMNTAFSAYKTTAKAYCAVAEASKDAKVRAEVADIIGRTQASIAKVALELDAAYHVFATVETTVRHDLLAALKPFKVIDRPLDEMHEMIRDIHHGMRDFDHTLHHDIDVKAAGVIVAKFSIHEILHDFDKTVHKLEHDLHVDKAKKWLEDELEKVFEPVIKAVLRPVERIEHRAKVEAKDFAEGAKAAFARFEKQAEQAVAIYPVDAEINGYAERMKALAAKNGK